MADGAVVFAAIVGCAYLGTSLRTVLPRQATLVLLKADGPC